jgi:hypothetical protein
MPYVTAKEILFRLGLNFYHWSKVKKPEIGVIEAELAMRVYWLQKGDRVWAKTQANVDVGSKSFQRRRPRNRVTELSQAARNRRLLPEERAVLKWRPGPGRTKYPPPF